METSILQGTKKLLGIAPTDTSFDFDVITHINSAFATLHQIGIGPFDGFAITGPDETWHDFFEVEDPIPPDPRYSGVQTYVVLQVSLWWDPPTQGYLLEAKERQIEQLLWRLNTQQEEDEINESVV